jgi:hypothetical protein
MDMYLITKKQLDYCIDAAYDAANFQQNWGLEEEADNYVALANELKGQAIVTEHFSFDEELRDKIVLELFKMGKYLDCLQSTFSQYCEEDAKEMLGNVWKCRDIMEVLLREKV